MFQTFAAQLISCARPPLANASLWSRAPPPPLSQALMAAQLILSASPPLACPVLWSKAPPLSHALVAAQPISSASPPLACPPLWSRAPPPLLSLALMEAQLISSGTFPHVRHRAHFSNIFQNISFKMFQTFINKT